VYWILWPIIFPIDDWDQATAWRKASFQMRSRSSFGRFGNNVKVLRFSQSSSRAMRIAFRPLRRRPRTFNSALSSGSLRFCQYVDEDILAFYVSGDFAFGFAVCRRCGINACVLVELGQGIECVDASVERGFWQFVSTGEHGGNSRQTGNTVRGMSF